MTDDSSPDSIGSKSIDLDPVNSDPVNPDPSHQADSVVSRRRFLQVAQIGGAGAVLAGCAPGGLEAVIHQVWQPVNQTVGELIFDPQKLAPEFPESAIQPQALLTNDSQTNRGLQTPLLDPQTYRLEITGDVAHPQILSLAQLQALPVKTMTIRHVCVEGWAAVVQWTGLPLQAIAQLVQPQASVRYVYFVSADGYYESWDLASALHPQTLLAYRMNGGLLPRENGAPIRLASPIKLGYKLSKWVVALAFLSNLPHRQGYWEDQGYEWYAGL
ncbi:MAG: molybdopterin-dependent oxidoreductase [Aphanocapsa sp. GSE-SYN-MK-11-07L]|jgi:DMSO/TMAO reductase YedYZ molybdopterin-dependent catalytic subunit|nr:molybdopterin-dependent oxidoreductase [Aphanocapsa sp. GSE-SYN-MK-11-07L]